MDEFTKYPDGHANGAQRNGTPAPAGPNGLYYPSPTDVEEGGISIHEIIEVFFKNKWLILASFILVLAGVTFYTLQQAPEYEASSTVYVNAPQAPTQLGDMLGLESANRNINNEIEILKSRRIAERVADELVDIERVPGTDLMLTVLGGIPDPSPENRLRIAERLQRRISVRQVSRGVDIIELTGTSTIPEEAALISTLYAQEYVEYNREQSRSRMVASREFLSEITDGYQKELQSSEDQLRDFLNRERVVAPDEEASQLIEQVGGLQGQLSQARLDLGMAKAEIRSLEDQAEEIRPGLAAEISSQISSVGGNAILQQLSQEIAALEVKIDTKYARNPGLKANPSLDTSGELEKDLRTLRTLQDRLDQRAGNLAADATGNTDVAGTLGKLQQQIMAKRVQVNVLEARLELLQEQLRRAEAQLGDIPRKDLILRNLQRSRQTTEQLYVALVEKLQEARIAEQSEVGYVDVIDKAVVPRGPVRPRVRFNLLFGALLGLMLGVGLAIVRSAVDNKVRKPEDLRKRGYTVAGVVPNMERVIRQDFNNQERVMVEGQEYSTRLIALLNPLSPVAEGYRRVRTNIHFSRPDKDVRTIMVTSPGPSEGKTVTALNLAITMAQSGRRTLYIDADLRRPQGHRMMGLPREPGLVDQLFDAVPDSVERFATELDSYLYVMPAGRDVPNPAEVLGSRKMQKLLKRWSKEFELVLIDTPPTLVVADALVLGAQCDAALVVGNAGVTTWQALDRCTEALVGVGADLLGVLLNRFDAKAAYGGYKYGYGYGYEYGYDNYYYGQSPTGTTSSRKPAARRV